MGFTFSHPALIVPFKYLPRDTYSITGLLIGSIVPDFEYFIRRSNKAMYSHTLAGLFWFDIPLALIMAIIYHQIIRDVLIRNLPAFFKVRFERFSNNNWITYLKKHCFIVVYSILIGALTHLFWDSFTSINGYFVRSNPFFLKRLEFDGTTILYYKILKHLSSMVGLLIVFYQLLYLPKSKVQNLKNDKYYWLILIIAFVLFLILRIPYINNLSYNHYIKTSIACGCLAIIVPSLFYRTSNRIRNN